MVNLLLRESIYIYIFIYTQYIHRERERIGGASLSKLKMMGPHSHGRFTIGGFVTACSCGAMGPWGHGAGPS